MRVIKVATSFQSLVTILDSKLKALESQPNMRLLTVSSPNDDNDPRKSAGDYSQITISRKISPLGDLLSIFRLFRFLKKNPVDVIHTHTAKAGMVGAVAARLAGVPLVCHTYHGLPFYEGQGAFSNGLFRLLEIFAARWRHVLFSQNRADFESLKKLFRSGPKVVFEGNGVDIESVQKYAMMRKGQVQGLFSHNKLRLLCVARLEPVKRLDKIIAAVATLLQSGISVECIIAGKGVLQSKLQTDLDAQGLLKSVKTLYTPHIHALIAESDIVILASEKEGIPRSILEAMALKKPVVATDVPGTCEVVVNNETGFLVPLDDQTALVEGIRKLAVDPSLRAKLGEAGFRRVSEQFSESGIAALWVRTYQDLLSARTQSPSYADLLKDAGKASK